MASLHTNLLVIRPTNELAYTNDTVALATANNGSLTVLDASSNTMIQFARQDTDTVVRFNDALKFSSATNQEYVAFSNGSIKFHTPLIMQDGSSITSAPSVIVGTSDILDGSITSAKLASTISTCNLGIRTSTPQYPLDVVGDANINGNMTIQGKLVIIGTLDNNLIGSNQILDGSITQAKLAANAVGSNQILGGSITTAKLAANAVGSNQILDSSLTPAKMFINNHVLPTACNAYDLGSSGLKYRDAYIGGTMECTNLLINGNPIAKSPWTSTSSNIYFSTSSNIGEGSVGIGTTSPSYKLHVVGDIYSSGNVTGFSDMRYKTDIVKINDALTKVLQVHGYTYNRSDQPNGPKYAGVIAQEIQNILPEVVSTDKDGFMSVAYGNIVALLIEAMHDMKHTMDGLWREINALKATMH